MPTLMPVSIYYARDQGVLSLADSASASGKQYGIELDWLRQIPGSWGKMPIQMSPLLKAHAHNVYKQNHT